MKVRIMGTLEECDKIVSVLILGMKAYPDAMEIRSISDWYPNRGKSKEGRVYVEIVRV